MSNLGARSSAGNITKALGLIFLGSMAALLIAELILRLFFPMPKQYFLWPPGLKRTFEIRLDTMPGVSDPSRFEINAIGIRGDPLPISTCTRMLTLGGSTTECLYLDQDETWPALLQRNLNATSKFKTPVWVGNLGKSGMTTRDHILHLKHLPPQWPAIHTIVCLPGVNDFLAYLNDPAYLNRSLDPINPSMEQLKHAFTLFPLPSDRSLLDHSRLWLTLTQIQDRTKPDRAKTQQDVAGSIYIPWRKNRATAGRILNELPPLDKALQDYRSNLQTMIRIAKSQNSRITFMTQPYLWRPGLTEKETRLLWMGGVGEFQSIQGCNYYSIESLAQGMNQYNLELKRVCADEKIPCLDLEALLPKEITIFYDEVHFNEAGSKEVARLLSEFLSNIIP